MFPRRSLESLGSVEADRDETDSNQLLVSVRVSSTCRVTVGKVERQLLEKSTVLMEGMRVKSKDSMEQFLMTISVSLEEKEKLVKLEKD